ncbi:hypothetical protein [Paenibacillus typhae]|uniref:hypothetical protein n=1 Tax=Paenibacillus typhae TaxID=1174501 RepID=UPI001C8EB437|nr:hypothetical protein [Paenibacillus typhae]MBY0011669.1 hypothetical protein [Paenibacillus typhae]
MIDVYKAGVLKAFKENFKQYKDKKIVLYGTGKVTEFIMEEYSDYNIIGFLDGNKKHGTAFGKNILSYEDVARLKPDIIIVAADKKNMQIIYDRICYLGYTNGIPIHAIDGRNLYTTYGYSGLTVEQQQYLEVNESGLREQIKAHEVIIFDIFDVLIMRKALLQTDVIEIVNERLHKQDIRIPDYIEVRLQAEKDVNRECGSIYDIYRRIIMHTGISENLAEQAMRVELDIEKSSFCCREKMRELLQFAVQSGKEVYLTADSYFPATIIQTILEDLNIAGYKKMYLSCEFKQTKEQGLLARILEDESVVKPPLYIGADKEAVIGYADKSNIDVFLIRSGYEMFLLSSYRNLQYSLQSVNERSMAGLLIAKLFNDPFALYQSDGRPEIRSVYDFGYTFIAPLITKYVLWIIDEVRKGQYTDVLIASRDGLITHKLYRFALRQLSIDIPAGIYFETSRTLCTIASIKAEEDIRWVADVPHAYDPDMMLKRRFDLKTVDIAQYNENIHSDVVSYALEYQDEIYKKAESVREGYLTYMEQIGLAAEGKYAFVDFVSSGTCQLLLNRFIPYEIEGLYFCKYNVNDEDKLLLPSQSLFENLIEKHVYCSYAYDHYLLLETMMTSFVPSIASIDTDGNFIYGEEDRSEEELQYVRDIHAAIEDYFREFLSSLYVADSEINKYFVDTLLSYRERKFTNEQCSIFENLRLLEDFGQWQMTLPR